MCACDSDRVDVSGIIRVFDQRMRIIIIIGLVSVFPVKTQKTCRLLNDTYLDPESFATQGCVACYQYDQGTKKSLGASKFQNVTYPTMMDDPDILQSFETDKGRQSWQTCCRKAVDCCDEQLRSESNSSGIDGNFSCPATWDGWKCWEEVPSNTIVHASCPDFIFSCVKEAEKTCTSDGKWFRHPQSNKEWTNYTNCWQTTHLARAAQVSIAAYAVSLVALIPALIIFHTFSILQCFRIVLHRNLFLSLLLHSIAKITHEVTIFLPEIQGMKIMAEHGLWCRYLIIINIFLTVSNYMWMMCEGLLLQRQLVNAFAEESRQWLFYSIGWGVPLFSASVITIYRLSAANENCWALPSSIDWMWYSPCLLSLLINFGFFVYILFVVVRTLSRQINDSFIQFRKAFRAGLVLVPLFGLHFLATMYRPSSVCTSAEEYYTYTTRAIEGLQGCIVAIIYCYINSDVRSALCRSYRNLSERRQLVHGQSTYMSAISTQTTI